MTTQLHAAHAKREIARRRMYRRRRITVGVLALLAIFTAYSAMIAIAPLPALHSELLITESVQYEPSTDAAQQVVDAQSLPTAVSWQGGNQIWSNDQNTHRIASISKVVTALVGLEAHPIDTGADADKYTVSAADDSIYDYVLSQEGVVTEVAPHGTQLTQYQLLELMLLPSANNYTIAYARWIFGSDAKFLSATKNWLQKNGLDSVNIDEPTGMSDNNVATASDVARIGELALANPTVAEVVAKRSAEIPGVGKISNSNELLADKGVLGIKTGTTYPASFSLVAAKKLTVAGKERVVLAATLDRADTDARWADTRKVLRGMKKSAEVISVVNAGDVVGRVTTWQGDTVELVAAASTDIELAPGDTGASTAKLQDFDLVDAGAAVGAIAVTAPAGETAVDIVTASEIAAPSFWWKFTHPGKLLGFT